MELQFNQNSPTTMHIDLNSCFATVEQQANPLLRGRPIVVAAYATNYGCVLAPSIEAKRYGIKTGMRVKEAKALCPFVKVLAADPPKYRYIYEQFCKLFRQYTPNMQPKSIDEAVLYMEGTPILKRMNIVDIGLQIQQRMRSEIGDWLMCNVGIAPNASLAKLAAGLHKPMGLDVIEHTNVRKIFSEIELEDFCGIAKRNHARLIQQNIYTPLQFLDASLQQLRAAFESVNGYYWYVRLRGHEIDNVEFKRRTIGHSYHLHKYTADKRELYKLLYKLTEKMGRRLRRHELGATGVHVSFFYEDDTYWHHGHKTPYQLYTTKDLMDHAWQITYNQPEQKKVKILAVNCFGLYPWQPEQLSLLPEVDENLNLTKALDKINNKWGEFTVRPATLMGMDDIIVDRIAFGKTEHGFSS